LPCRIVAAGERLLVQRCDIIDAGRQTLDVLANGRHALQEVVLRKEVAAALLRRECPVLFLLRRPILIFLIR
jgi:hypothetical protein